METPALEIRDLSKSFPQFRLGPLNLCVPQGAIYGFIGPNGSGKSTTLELIMGMGAKESGSINVFGMDHIAEEVEVKKRIGFFSPDTQFVAWGRVNRALNFFRGFYETWDDDYSMGLLDRFNLKWDAKIATLSFGERTKLGLVLALSHRPPLLLLDEPMSGLDPVTRREVYTELLDVVQDEGRSVLISSHNLDEIERFADHIGIIQDGKMLLEGSTASLLARHRMLDATLRDGALAPIHLGITLQHRDGVRARILIDTQLIEVDALVQYGIVEFADVPMSLEDLFIGLIKTPGKRAA